MKTMNVARKTLAGLALSLALLGMSKDASAAGAALNETDLPAATRADLKTEIAKARAATPELFKQVSEIAAHARDLDAGARAPGVPLTLHFKPLGNRALYPMLEALVFDSHAERDLPPTAAAALRLGLIESVGSIRDARAIPVLAKILETARDEKTARVSSEGLSRIGTDAALDILQNAAVKAKTDGAVERERSILSGMHDARRERAARFLTKRLQGNVDVETARVVAKSLGGVGNAWAWRTLSDQSEASATRGIAANTLVDIYVRFGGDVREQAAKAILIVDDASTPTLIALARKGASADLSVALDQLDQRFATNPTH